MRVDFISGKGAQVFQGEAETRHEVTETGARHDDQKLQEGRNQEEKRTERNTALRGGGYNHMSCVMRKPAFCICENKDADQLRGNREADQRLCFHYTDSTIPLLSKYEISSL